MAVAPAPAFDEVYDFLLSGPTPRQIVAFAPTEETRLRISSLLDRNREGVITIDEQTELDEFGRVEHFVRMLKIKAQARFAG